jgi:hypothetical protein
VETPRGPVEVRAPGEGWISFVGVLFLVVGAFNIIAGIVALVEDDHFVTDELFFGDLSLWGVVMLAIGALQLLTAWLVLARSAAGVFLGVFLASVNLINHLFFIGVYPVWSVIIMVVDVMVIYGLTVYGYRPQRRA